MRSYSVDKTIIIKAHALKYFTNLASHQPLQNRTVHRKSPSPLPPLSKVRCCRPIKFGRRPEGLSYHHSSPRTNPSKTALSPLAFCRARSSPLPLHRLSPFPQPLKKNNTPSPRTTTLASLVKGRWIGGKAQTLTLLHLLAICPPFLYCKLFCRQDGGIATPTAPFPFL